jgi:hypothetical protein
MWVRKISLPNKLISGTRLRWVGIIRLPSKLINGPASFLAKNVGFILCLALIAVTLTMYVPDRQKTNYYHMIDEEDYQAFVWIRDNINENHEKAILDPWKATAFTAITQKSIYTRIHAYPKPSDMEAYKFLEDGCTDTSFMRENGISIIYTKLECNNPDLKKVNKFVYVLE